MVGRVVGIDLVGFGWSERPTEVGPHLTVRGRAALLEAVADEVGLGTVDVLGQDLLGVAIAEIGDLDPGAPEPGDGFFFCPSVVPNPKKSHQNGAFRGPLSGRSVSPL